MEKVRKNLYLSGIPGREGKVGHSPLLIKGTLRREKVRKNLNPPEKSEAAKIPDHGPLLI